MRRHSASCFALVPALLCLAALALPVAAGAHHHDEGKEHDLFEAFWPRDRARLGIEVQPMTPELRRFMDAPEDRGVLVVRVDPEGAAAEAGVAVGDVILAAGEADARRPVDLVRALDRVDAGGKVTLLCSRKGKERTIEIAPDGEPSPWSDPQRWSERVDDWMERGFDHGRERLRDRLEALEDRLEELEERLDREDGAATPT